MANELFEMANVSKKDTKLPYDIWIDSEGKNRNIAPNYPRLKVDCNGDRIPVSISENPEILVKKRISEFPKVRSCVIVQDDEYGLVYRRKCERCGHVQSGSVMSGRIPKGFRVVKQFRCEKCGAQNKLEIQG